MARETRRLWLTFSAEACGKPLLCELAQKFDIKFTIRNASVTKEMGIIAIEIDAERDATKQAITWLESSGVQVEPVELNTIEG